VKLALVLLASCGDGIAPSLRFTPLENEDVTRLVAAALGVDASRAVRAFEKNAASVDGCPFVTQSDTVTTLTGGCTTAEGFPVSGLARRVVEPDVLRYEFDAFVVPEHGTRFSVDGVVELSKKLPPDPFRADEYGEHAIDILVEERERAVRSHLRFTCVRDEGCRSDEISGLTSSAIELVGSGGALVAGRGYLGLDVDVDMTILGLETVEVLVVKGFRDCLHWRIVGTDRSDAPFGCPR
jgi:hypothetical protein